MKTRLDLLLVNLGLTASRQRAKELILKGQVYLGEENLLKPSQLVANDSVPEIKGFRLDYPSRAGLKLEKALEVFDVDVENSLVLDVGASTGGFTSCLLKYGAKRVYAVDVGQDQLDVELRGNERVVNLEKTDIRQLKRCQLHGELMDLVTVDVSFISLRLVFPAIRRFLKPAGQVITLVKPQFETGGVGLNKRGVIKEQRFHVQFVPPLIEQLQDGGLGLRAFEVAEPRGLQGNIEFLACFQSGKPKWSAAALVQSVIASAWE